MQDGGPGVGPGHGFGGIQAERAGEHRQVPEDALLRFGQQLVAPVDGGVERPLPGGRGPVGADQQPVVEPVQQRPEAQCLDSGRGQLDGQRHSVQPLHVLAVVQDQEQLPPGQVGGQGVRDRPARQAAGSTRRTGSHVGNSPHKPRPKVNG
jgi:hypothetical protein